jgi:predicted ribosome quality control (RQC) complex YloA/Tae2 family protein
MKQIPFDSLCLASVVNESKAFSGAKLQEIRQPNPYEVHLELYAAGAGRGTLAICVHPRHPAVFFATRRAPGSGSGSTGFQALLRKRLENARLVDMDFVPGERRWTLHWRRAAEELALVIELMGPHATASLVQSGTILGVLRRARPGGCVRQGGRPFVEPEPRPGYGKFLESLAQAEGKSTVEYFSEPDAAVITDLGAYPRSVAALGYAEHRRPSFSVAMEQAHARLAVSDADITSLARLSAQLERLRSARETARSGLLHAIGSPDQRARWRALGDALMAEGPALAPDAQRFERDGQTVTWGEDETYILAAENLYRKAKRAEALRLEREEHLAVIEADLSAIASLERLVASGDAPTTEREMARRRWLNAAPETGTQAPAARPFEGHKIRDLSGPGGVRILMGENAEANDYLVTRVSRPNDLWFHVRGHTSAHVLLQTGNRPERIQPVQLEFAARMAAQNSPLKHSHTVPVDYALRKYVRKPKGAPAGTVTYDHERTLHVDPRRRDDR